MQIQLQLHKHSYSMKFSDKSKLDANENVLGTSPKALDAIAAIINKSNSYPDPFQKELKSKIATLNQIAATQVSVSAGSTACLDYIVQGLTAKNETILAFERSFVAYKELARVHKRNYVEVPMLDHLYSFDRLYNLITDEVKLIFLDIPNNPTGQILTHEDIELLMQKVNPLSFVVLDEAYAEYADSNEFPRTKELFLKYPNLIIVRTFSKIHGLAGIRCGYTLAKESVLRKIDLYKPPFTVNHFAVAAASAAIDDEAFIKKSIKQNKEEREFLHKNLSRLGFNVLPTQGNFIYVYFDDDLIKESVIELLKESKINICNLSVFGLDRAIRITVGIRKTNEKIVSALSV